MNNPINNRHSYPRTYHLPFSKSVQDDDKIVKDFSQMENEEVIGLLKLDGENTSLYKGTNNFHARSLDSAYNWTRSIVKQTHIMIQDDIPEKWRLCCENVYAKHSIAYPDNYLEGYLYLLSIWNEKNECLNWDDTVEYAKLFDLPVPEVKYRGEFNLKEMEKVCSKLDTSLEEGIVFRIVRKFSYNDFSKVVTKFVRSNHVQTDQHWLKNAVPNGLPQLPCKPEFLTAQFTRKNKFKP